MEITVQCLRVDDAFNDHVFGGFGEGVDVQLAYSKTVNGWY